MHEYHSSAREEKGTFNTCDACLYFEIMLTVLHALSMKSSKNVHSNVVRENSSHMNIATTGAVKRFLVPVQIYEL